MAMANRSPQQSSALVQELSASEQRLGCVIELSSNYYWEQDESHRFTLIRHHNMSDPGNNPWRYLGKTHWELGTSPLGGPSAWRTHKALRAERQPFRDFIVCDPRPAGGKRYLSISGQPIYNSIGEFIGYRGITRDVTREQERSRLLRLERTVTQILADASDQRAAINATLRAICESEDWDSGNYWFINNTGPTMRFFAGWHDGQPQNRKVGQHARQLEFSQGAGLVGTVWETGQPLWVPDLSNEYERLLRKNIMDESGWLSAMLFPVTSEGQIIGVLDFNSRRVQGADPDERLVQVISIFATQIGNFYQRSVALEQLRASEKRYADTVELAAIGISHINESGHFIHANRRVCEILGYTKDELLQLTVKQVSHPEDVNVTDANRTRLLHAEIGSFKAEKRYLRKDGSIIWVGLTIAVNREPSGELLYEIAVMEDISERKRAEERVQYLATHDEMTGLQNRTAFTRCLDETISHADPVRNPFSLLFIDLDHFKVVNDSFGHSAGDRLLTELSGRIKACLTPNDVLSRFGGDEFVALIRNIGELAPLEQLSRRILTELTRYADACSHACQVTASIGIARYPTDGTNAQTLLQHADMAMYCAKDAGKNRFATFDQDSAPID